MSAASSWRARVSRCFLRWPAACSRTFVLRPAVWKAQDRARDKGHANGPRSGDIWRMPGAFLVQGDRVLWAHEYRHAADHPDYGHIRDVACDAAGCGEAR